MKVLGLHPQFFEKGHYFAIDFGLSVYRSRFGIFHYVERAGSSDSTVGLNYSFFGFRKGDRSLPRKVYLNLGVGEVGLENIETLSPLGLVDGDSIEKVRNLDRSSSSTVEYMAGLSGNRCQLLILSDWSVEGDSLFGGSLDSTIELPRGVCCILVDTLTE